MATTNNGGTIKVQLHCYQYRPGLAERYFPLFNSKLQILQLLSGRSMTCVGHIVRRLQTYRHKLRP